MRGGRARLLAFGIAGLLLTTACEAFPPAMQDDPEAIEPIAGMSQDITITEPPSDELKQRIVFQQGPIRPEIYTMGTNGYDPRRLTKNVQADREPSWSFDAQKIVYRCHILTLCTSNPDGSDARQVYTHTSPPATDIGDPKLSPDGRSVAFDAEVSTRGAKTSTVGDIFVVNLATKAVTNVSNTPTREDDDPEWHPTGGLLWVRDSQLVYDEDGLPGGEVLTLTPAGTRVSKPDVSPSGNKIAYVAKLAGDNQTDVYVFDLTAPTAADQKVTFTPFDDLAPSWSPNERKIALASKDQPSDQDLEIFVVDLQPPEGGTPTRRRLTFNTTDETEPDWGAPQVTASVQQRISLPEGNPASGQTTGTKAFSFALFLSAPVAPGEQVTVRVATLAGSASTGNDYTALDQVFTFEPGEQTKTLTVNVVTDTVSEPNESFSVRILETTNALKGNVEGRAIITNDDIPPTPSPTPPPTASPTPAPPGVAGGQIAYTSGVDGDYDVWIMDGSGASKRNLTSDPSPEGSPDLGPDGRTVAFQRALGSPSAGTPPNFEIFGVPSAGGTAARINGLSDAFDVTPAWSPDGSSIAWVSSTSAGNPDIYTATPATGSPAKLLETAEIEGYTEWGRLASGTEAIAYHVQPVDPAGQWEVRLVELPSKTVRSFGEGRHPEISPDGRKLVFASNRSGGDYEIYVLDLSAPGATPVALTSNTVEDATPSWSPDGTKIAWTSHPDGGRADVFTMNANGSGQLNVTNSPATDDFEPSWGIKPATSSPQEAPAAVLVVLPLAGLASALATRRRRR